MIFTLDSIIKAATCKDGPLNIIMFTENESYESLIAQANHNFYAFNTRQKEWIFSVRPRPEKYNEATALQHGLGYNAVLSLGRNINYETCLKVSKELHVPLIIFEKDYPQANKKISKIKGHINIFLSDDQAKEWGFSKDEYELLTLGVDTNIFKPKKVPYENKIFTAINNWRKKDWSHGFRLYNNVVKDLPVKAVGGSNKGITEDVHWQELVRLYQTSAVYFNPTVKTAAPLQILEAMACGCPVVAFDTGDIKKYVIDDYNGYLIPAGDIELAREKLQDILASKFLREQFSKNALKTVEVYNLDKFTKQLDYLFNKARNIVYTGN